MNRRNKNIFFLSGLSTAILIGAAWGQSPSGAAVTNTAFVSYDGGAGTVLTMPSDTVVTWISRGALSITKTALTDQVTLGDTLGYEIRVQNTGDAALLHVLIRDSLPPMLSFVRSTLECRTKGNSVEWEIPDLAAGETAFIRLTCRVVRSAYMETIENSIKCYSKVGPPRLSKPSRVRWLPWPEAELEKSVSPLQAFIGDTLTFGLRARNTGSVSLTHVEVRDTLPEGINFISSSTSLEVEGRIVSWTVGSLNPGAEVRMVFKAVVNADASGDSLRNIAFLSCAEIGPHASAAAAAPVAFRGRGVGLEIIKQAADSVYAAGDTLTYNLILHNSGIRAGHRITVRDTLPPGLEYVDSSHGGLLEGRIVRWELSDLDAGLRDTLRISASIRVPVEDGTRIENRAWARCTEGSQDSSRWNIRVISRSGIAFEKTVLPLYALIGDTVTYSLRVRNTGTTRLTRILVSDSLPRGIEWVDSDPPLPFSGGILNWQAGGLEYREEKRFSFRGVITPGASGDSIRNTAGCSSGETGTTASTASIRLLRGGPGIEIVKQAASRSYSAGDTLTYDLILSSNIPQRGLRITVRDTLPETLRYVGSTRGGRCEDGRVIWELGPLEPGYHDTLRVSASVRVPVDDGTRIENRAWARCSEGSQDSSRWSIRVISRPGVAFEKKVLSSSCIVGDTLTYSLRARNTGTASLTRVLVTDTLSKGIVFVSSSPPMDTAGGVLRWNLNGLAYRQQKELVFKVLVTADASGDSLRNTAVLSSAEFGSTASSAAVAFRGWGAGIEIVKQAKSHRFFAGDTVNYDLILSNGIPRPDTKIVVRDTLPRELRFISASHRGICTDSIVIWNLENLQPGFHDTLRMAAAIRKPIEDQTPVDNEAWACSSTGARDSSRWSIVVNSPPVLTLKVLGPKITHLGDTLRYKLAYSNIGTVTAFNPVLTDTLPEYLEFVAATGAFSLDLSARTIKDLPLGKNSGDDADAAAISAGRLKSDGAPIAGGSSGAVAWKLPTLRPGDGDTLLLDVRVTERLGSRREVDNAAWLSCFHSMGSIRVMDSAITVLEQGTLFIYKTVDRPTASSGDTLTYCIRYGVLQKDVREPVFITDILPKELHLIQESFLGKATARFDAYDPLTNQVNFVQDGLSVGRTDSIVFKTIAGPTFDPGVRVIENRSLVRCESDTAFSMDDSRTRARTRILRPFLSVKKTVNRKVAEAGEALTYTVTLENKSQDTPLASFSIRDLIPEGFRYQAGTSRLDSARVFDPEIHGQGKRALLVWMLPDTLPPGKILQLKYRLVVGLSVQRGERENLVTASSFTFDGIPVQSDEATTSVLISRGAFDENGLIIGKVYEDRNRNGMNDGREPALKNIELILEDGTHVRTDEFGKYSIPDVEPGQHVLRLNERTLPKNLKILLNEFEYLDDPKSRIVLVPPGGMVKANFGLERTQ
jgi:uncharacterized repeat protein (TIGR01451 family)